ncbi:AraC family transcriptional regulator [Clostridium lacusfryxellense]|uniref:AraC family transcriptional regulator n=1 Tax=Clostridium lacusfryxellense TaxID=205328 RepID=UPI001C0CDF85|nr:AraC family transcriptional regulator [Clostridium lacusfryxellense]MBU3113281.1 AraC family transcriptional regulator [Clostridium lacusfryxellense]
MYIETEIIQMPDPSFPIKTYIVDNLNLKLAANYHVHPEIEIIYMIKGSMTFRISGCDVVVNEGKILLINSMAVHASSLTSDPYVKMCLLQFKPDVIYSSGHFSEFKYLAPFLQEGDLNYQIIDSKLSKDFQELTKCLNEIVIEFTRKTIAYELSIKSIIYRILTILYRNGIFNLNNMINLYKKKENFKRLEPVINYVENNYKDDITLEKACDILKINYYYFCRVFKNATGNTFIQYLNFVRISVAENLLVTTDMTITDVIFETGFSSLSYFNRTFKKFKGCSPSQYKKFYISKS